MLHSFISLDSLEGITLTANLRSLIRNCLKNATQVLIDHPFVCILACEESLVFIALREGILFLFSWICVDADHKILNDLVGDFMCSCGQKNSPLGCEAYINQLNYRCKHIPYGNSFSLSSSPPSFLQLSA